MKRLVNYLTLIIFLAACSHGSGDHSKQPEDNEPVDPTPNPVPNPNLPSYSFNFDRETPGGIKIESNNLPLPPLADIDTWYSEVRQCIADWYEALYPDEIFEFVPPPPFIVQNNDISGYCEGIHGNGAYCTNYYKPFAVLEAGWAQYEFLWKHESTHHILYQNGFSDSLNVNHMPDEIWDCQFQ